MSNDPAVAAKEAQAQAARARLQNTLAALKDKVNPPNVAHRAVDAAKVKAVAAAEAGAETVRDNPIKVAGAAAAIGLLLARKPILRLFRRREKPDAE